jgi:hypothetical protein
MTADPEFVVKESSPVDAVLSLDVTTDHQHVLLTLHFESDTAVRLPMPVEIAMRVWACLDKARRDHDWSAPATPVSTETLQ